MENLLSSVADAWLSRDVSNAFTPNLWSRANVAMRFALLLFDWGIAKILWLPSSRLWRHIYRSNWATSSSITANTSQKFSLFISDAKSVDGKLSDTIWSLNDPVSCWDSTTMCSSISSGSEDWKKEIRFSLSRLHWSLSIVASSTALTDVSSTSDFIIDELVEQTRSVRRHQGFQQLSLYSTRQLPAHVAIVLKSHR